MRVVTNLPCRAEAAKYARALLSQDARSGRRNQPLTTSSIACDIYGEAPAEHMFAKALVIVEQVCGYTNDAVRN